MKLRPSGYDLAVVAAAFVAWGICLVALAPPSMILSFLDQLRDVGISADWRTAVMNGLVLIVIALSVVGVATHIFVCSRKALKQRFQPTLASHLAFLALLWLAVGGIWVCVARSYPFIKSGSQNTEQTGPPNP
jgi:heme/copper-type cytochrome/quinol oxidase subunit 2